MSTYYSILSAIKTRIEGLAGFSGATVVIRKTPAYWKESDTLPLVILSPRVELVKGLQFKGKWISYPVVVTQVRQADTTAGTITEMQTIFDRREEIFDSLFQSSATGVSAVFDVEYNGSPDFDSSAIDQSLDVSQQEFIYTAALSRT